MKALARNLGQFVVSPYAHSGNASSIALSTTALWCGFSFVATKAKTLNKVMAWLGTVTGTAASVVIECHVYTDVNGIPGASLSSVSKTGVTASVANEWTGLSQALTEGTRYWIVFKCTSAPTHYAPIAFYPHMYSSALLSDGIALATNAGHAKWGCSKVHTSDSGTNWTGTPVAGVTGLKCEFSDGTYIGESADNVSTLTSSTVYANRAIGNLIKTPEVLLPVVCVAIWGYFAGTPTGNAVIAIYQGSTLIATSIPIPLGNCTAYRQWSFYFSNICYLQPKTEYRIVLAETAQSDSSSNYYGTFRNIFKDATECNRLYPTVKTTYTTDRTANPITWDESGSLAIWTVPMVLGLHESVFALNAPIPARTRTGGR